MWLILETWRYFWFYRYWHQLLISILQNWNFLHRHRNLLNCLFFISILKSLSVANILLGIFWHFFFFWEMNYFVWRKHENMSPCTGSRVYKYKLWANCFMRWMPVLNRGGPRILDPSPPTVVASVLTTRTWAHDPSAKKGLAPAERHHTLATTVSWFWAGTIPHWAAYTWHWRIDIILYEGNMRTCLHALAAGSLINE